MKIYFAGSIRGGRDDQELYSEIIKELQNHGEVLSEHFGNKELTSYGDTDITEKEIFDRDMNWVRESDVIVAEVSTPSLGVGYELGQSESMNKKIICLYREQEGKRLSAMLSGNSFMKIFTYKNIDDVRYILKNNLI